MLDRRDLRFGVSAHSTRSLFLGDVAGRCCPGGMGRSPPRPTVSVLALTGLYRVSLEPVPLPWFGERRGSYLGVSSPEK
jgi:hypothetical protein